MLRADRLASKYVLSQGTEMSLNYTNQDTASKHTLQLLVSPDFPEQERFKNTQELADLLAQQRVRLRRFVRKHMRNEDLVDDVVQAASFEAYKNWGNFRGDSRPETWLFGIAFNLTRNFKTKQYRLDHTFEALDDSHFEQPSDFNEQPMQQLLRKQEINQLKNAIERLPSRMQSVVSAVLLEGLSYQEAAEELNLPIGTVRSRLSRARDMLRDLMGIH